MPASFDPSTQFAIGGIGFVFGTVAIFVTQYVQRRFERHTMSRSLLAEITKIQSELNYFGEFLATETRSQVIGANDRVKVKLLNVPVLWISKDDMSIYNSNTAKIGFFRESTAASLVEYYGSVRTLKEQSDGWEIKDYDGSLVDKGNTVHARCEELIKLNEAAIKDGQSLIEKLSSELFGGSLKRNELFNAHINSSFRKVANDIGLDRLRRNLKRNNDK